MAKTVNFNIYDTLIAITDSAMKKCYLNDDFVSLDNCYIYKNSTIESFNLFCPASKLINTFNDITKFFLIAGSSNFHHLEVSRLKNLKERLNTPLQLILFDRHMDAQFYNNKDRLLTCGNWISFAVRQNLVSNVILCGCNDETMQPAFDSELLNSGKIIYHKDISLQLDSGLLNLMQPTYISVDTDILNFPSDWGRGKLSLENFLSSPVWQQLKQCNIVGAGIMGHVTDNRRAIDMIYAAYKRRRELKSSQCSMDEIKADIIYGLFPKMQASWRGSPLDITDQFNIIYSVYQKIAAINPLSCKFRRA